MSRSVGNRTRSNSGKPRNCCQSNSSRRFSRPTTSRRSQPPKPHFLFLRVAAAITKRSRKMGLGSLSTRTSGQWGYRLAWSDSGRERSQSSRSGPSRSQRSRRSRQPHQKRLHRQHEPRAENASQRYFRLRSNYRTKSGAPPRHQKRY